jgi:parallel beta-helix repeat protein
MNKSQVYSLILVLVLIGVFASVARFPRVEASGTTVYIRADGSIDPPDVSITSSDNVTYTFTNDISYAIIGERSDITIDGAGHTLQNPGAEYYGIRADSINNITIRNVKITGFKSDGIMLQYDADCKIYNNTLTENNSNGIELLLQGSANMVVFGNKIINNGNGGIYVQSGSGNYIYGNDIIRNHAYGISLHVASSNYVYENNIVDNNILGYYSRSISLSGGSTNNLIFSNNIIGESPLAYTEVPTVPNSWNASGYGNYWSDYSGQDLNSDGIGDTPYAIANSTANVDYSPLMNQNGTITRTYAPYAKEVKISSNTLRQISFNATGTSGTTGFCNITFPTDLLWGTITVYKDNTQLTEGSDYTRENNGSYTTLHFTYTHSTHEFRIVGTEALPEFPHVIIIMPLLMLTALLAVVTRRKRALANTFLR